MDEIANAAALPQKTADSANAAPLNPTAAAATVETMGQRIGRYRWVICALLFFATTVNYVDRQVLGQLPEAVGADLLCEVPAARPQHAGNLLPPGCDRVSTGHQIEGVVAKREALPGSVRHHEKRSARP